MHLRLGFLGSGAGLNLSSQSVRVLGGDLDQLISVVV